MNEHELYLPHFLNLHLQVFHVLVNIILVTILLLIYIYIYIYCLIFIQTRRGSHNKITYQHTRFYVLTTVIKKDVIFWDLRPCSLVEIYRRFGRTCCLHLQSRIINPGSKVMLLLACLFYSSTQKMDTILSSEILVYFCQTARRNIRK
jgi:hypothetical protein